MATATHFQLRNDATARFRVPDISTQTAAKASELLQKNHESHDLIFNDDGLHSGIRRVNYIAYHIAHHMFTAFALGAEPSVLQSGYDQNTTYQRGPRDLDEDLVSKLKDPQTFIANMGNPRGGHTFQTFFENEISKNGYEAVLNEYLFKGDERANMMFNRAFSSIYHPIIHLGFGLEFKQPSMIAESLAETTFHPDYYDPFFNAADRKAKERTPKPEHMTDLIDEMHQDKQLVESAQWPDENKIRTGVLKRGLDRMTDYQSRWQVTPGDMDERLAEVTNAAVYIAAAAQNPRKEVKFDFFLMHGANSTIFFYEFMKQDWISTANKVKLLEWRGREDLLQYVARGSPKLRLEEIVNYKAKHPGQDWKALIDRVNAIEDDGHASKLVRALAHGQKVCASYEHQEHLKIKGDMWLTIGHMAVDSTEGAETRWARNIGWEQAWEKFADRQA